MARVTFPAGGDVAQTINPWRFFFMPFGSQFGLINIDLGRSSDPDTEREVLDDVASYGRQLGRMGDALAVLLDHFHPERPLTETERDAVDDLRSMLAEIARVKRRRARRR
ncbi:hypothetical protein [Hansschlegelia plantiphila]|uniref:Uncharacterized protein n=1 Tax=Hansschlegelia plantiphila TaxID=374655 RepID=A0A9W6MVM3_9HYPH|nr:hypothetical protein [Hansschlegelia plantiphila]GLK67885.1 hypothetical protein GCM10008179_15230 [Hansschlegelia plantiphila]